MSTPNTPESQPQAVPISFDVTSSETYAEDRYTVTFNIVQPPPESYTINLNAIIEDLRRVDREAEERFRRVNKLRATLEQVIKEMDGQDYAPF